MQNFYPVVIDKTTGEQKILNNRHILTSEEVVSIGVFSEIEDSIESLEIKQIIIPNNLKEFYLTAKDPLTGLVQIYNFKVQYINSVFELFIQSIIFNGNQSSLFFDDSEFSLILERDELKLSLKSAHSQPLNLIINK